MSEVRENGARSASPEPAAESETSPSPAVSQTLEVLEDLLERVEDYNSVIPDSVTSSILQGVGVDNQNSEVTRLISLAAQKFISDIAVDALTHNKMRQSMCGKKSSRKEKKFVMNTEDLMEALKDKGISVKRQPYY